MRSIGMDVHRSFAQVAVFEDGQITESCRVDMEHDAVVAFGQSLLPEDAVILEGETESMASSGRHARGTGIRRQLSDCCRPL